MYTVIGPAGTRAFRVLWMLEELDVPYEHIPHSPQSADVRAMNPLGKVPVLVEGSEILTDSTAILTYLADRHGRLTAPAGTLDRGRQDAVTQFLLDEVDGCLWTAARHSFILPPEHRKPEIKDSLRWEFARSMGHLATLVSASEFVAGPTFTLADVIAGQCLRWAERARFDIAEPVVRDYALRMQQRLAFRRVAGEPSP